MKLTDITETFTNEPNALWTVRNHNGYYRITGFGERKVGDYQGKARKTYTTIEAVRVFFKPACAESIGYEGEVVPAQPDRIQEGKWVESFLPSQVDGRSVLGKSEVSMDNLLELEVAWRAKNRARIAELEKGIQEQVNTLNSFLGESFVVQEFHLVDKFWLGKILEAVTAKLQESEQLINA